MYRSIFDASLFIWQTKFELSNIKLYRKLEGKKLRIQIEAAASQLEVQIIMVKITGNVWYVFRKWLERKERLTEQTGNRSLEFLGSLRRILTL